MIKVENVTKEFPLSRKQRKELGDEYKTTKKICAVDNISFECKPGRIFGLLGPNGAGKTTTLRMIATMLKPSSGSIDVSGYDTVDQGQNVREQIGFMTGQTALYDRLTPTEMVKYIADLYGMKKEDFSKRKDYLFDALDMNSFSDRRISRLSTGMKQKTSIARTMIHDPSVMVFDEPTSGLDVNEKTNLRSRNDISIFILVECYVAAEMVEYFHLVFRNLLVLLKQTIFVRV